MIKLLKESYGDLSNYLERHLDSWYGRLNELGNAIEDLGLDVDEINNEYVIVHATEPDGEDVYCKIKLGGTPRTISLETFEMLESVRRSKKAIKESIEVTSSKRNKLLEKSNFDDTEKAINYYYPKWYYDDMSVNDIYDRLEKLGHSQDFIDAVIDGITSRYENEEDYGLDDYDECLTEDSLDDIVRPEIKKRYIWPLYDDCAYEVVEIIEKYQNTNRFKNEIKGFDLQDISYMDWPALQLEVECSNEVYVFIRNDIEREGLFVDDDEDIDESIQESKVGDVEDSKLPKRAKDYLKSMGWDSANIDGDVYYIMHFSGNEDCDLYIDEFGNCYLVVGEYDVKPTDMFYTIVDDYKTDIDDLMKLGDMVASGNDVDKVMELFFG